MTPARSPGETYNWDTGTQSWPGSPSVTRKFVWNGWLMLLELKAGTGVPPVDTFVRKYTWGRDLRARQGGAGIGANPNPDREGAGPELLESAGGIGGLLAVEDNNGTIGTTSR